MTPASASPPLLNAAQKRVLLNLARSAVEAQVQGERLRPSSSEPLSLPEASGTFVTLTHDGELRGCLGTLECRDGLATEVARCAANAASRDHRFAPVSPQELPGVSIEVSVLGPLELIEGAPADAVVVGRHGLVVEQGRSRGLLLPQVAEEHGWTAEAFLGQTCVKAGLPADAWKRGARVYRFEADVFGEPSIGS